MNLLKHQIFCDFVALLCILVCSGYLYNSDHYQMGPEQELKLYDNDKSWSIIYQRLRNEASLRHNYSIKSSKILENKNRNRYRDVSPYDHSRIQLLRHDLDYINANLVRADDANRQYILTQGPLPSTAGHFWLMVWEQNSKAVLMLNRIKENEQIKCFQYYPVKAEGENSTMVFDDVDLEVTFVSDRYADYYTVRTLRLRDTETNDTKEVLQFHYTNWPDFGVPASPGDFLNFLIAVRESGALDISDEVGPPVIHCSAGIGRSGTFILVDTCLVLIDAARSCNDIDVKEVLMGMRQYRMGLIQTFQQLRFSYLAIIEGARDILSIAMSPDSGFGGEQDNITHHDLYASHRTPLLNNLDDDSSSDDTDYIDDDDDGDDDIDSDDSIPTEPAPMPPAYMSNYNSIQQSLGEDFYPEPSMDPPEVPPPLPPRGAKTFINEPEESYSSPQNEAQSTPGPTSDMDTAKEPVSEPIKQTTTDNENSQLRRRKREEKNLHTATMIKNMKEKQKNHELWKSRKAKVQPWAIGVTAILVVGSIFLCKYYIT